VDSQGTAAKVSGTTGQSPVSANITIGAVPITLLVWTTSGVSAPSSKYVAAVGTTTEIAIRAGSGGTWQVTYNSTSANDTASVDTRPHMIGMTNSGATNGLILYRDGVSVATATKALASFAAAPVGIGGPGSGAGDWTGTIGQQMLWVGRALSAADIAHLYADRWMMIKPPGGRR
jgi:hypothetical protein